MKAISRRSRPGSALRVTLSLAMLLSLVAIPAFGSTDAALSGFAPGTTALVDNVSFSNPGLNGTLSGSI